MTKVLDTSELTDAGSLWSSLSTRRSMDPSKYHSVYPIVVSTGTGTAL